MTSDRYEAAKRLVHVALTGLPHGEEREAELRNAIRVLESVVEEERAAMREVVQDVANGATVHRHHVEADPTDPEMREPSDYWMCAACGSALSSDVNAPRTRGEAAARIPHTPFCPYTKARALPAQQAE